MHYDTAAAHPRPGCRIRVCQQLVEASKPVALHEIQVIGSSQLTECSHQCFTNPGIINDVFISKALKQPIDQGLQG